ncbi:hypothetical protein BG842_02530 [Haladaptatus sp. W1]|nr:hypothetical protein BG842_02530 [Haladaptatus sp. W1]
MDLADEVDVCIFGVLVFHTASVSCFDFFGEGKISFKMRCFVIVHGLTVSVILNDIVVGELREVVMDERDPCLFRGCDGVNFLVNVFNQRVEFSCVRLLIYEELHSSTSSGIREQFADGTNRMV